MKTKIKNYLLAGSLVIAGNSFGQDQECIYLASDVYPGSYGSLPSLLTEYNGAIYFSATGNAQGLELWKFENGVSTMVADINPGFGGSMLNNFVVAGGYLYFSANNGTSGIELFRYDGTTVTMVTNINPGAGSAMITKLTAVGSELYFFATDGLNGMEPWKFDGTTATMLGDLEPGAAGSNGVDIEGFNGNVFFTATTTAYGLELWQYDGSSIFVHDIYPGPTGSDCNELTSIGTKLCLRAFDGTQGYEVWVHDGTSLTCTDANPGAGHHTPWELTEMNGELYCRGYSDDDGYEFWKYDGTSWTQIMDIKPGASGSSPNNLTVVNGDQLYFAASSGSATGNELWHYDSNTGTCVLAADIYTGSTGSMPVFYIERMASVNEHVFMVATSATSGYEVWHYDGTTAELGKDIVPGSASSNPTALKAFGNKLYWTADDLVAGGELWVWDVYADLVDSIDVINCGSYTSPAGDVYSVEGVYNFTDTIPSVNCPGCDSLINVDLIVTQPNSSITVFACNEYTAPSGAYYNLEGTYTITDIIPSIACAPADSVITIDLTIVDGISTAVVVFSGVILAQQSGAGYQWLDCDNGYAPIPGATDQDFLPTADGNYACEITMGSCSDTTGCYFVEAEDPDPGIGFEESQINAISLYPNPVSGTLTLELKQTTNAYVRIIANPGAVVYEGFTAGMKSEIDLGHLAPGVYFIEVHTVNTVITQKLVKQ